MPWLYLFLFNCFFCLSDFQFFALFHFLIIFLMILENIQKKSQKKNERLIQNMKKAENLKSSIAKLSKLTMRNYFPTHTPKEHSMISNSQNNEKITMMSPLSSRQASFCNQIKCKECEKFNMLLFKQRKQKQQYEEKWKQLLKISAQKDHQRMELMKKISKYEEMLSNTHQALQPYKKNVILMEQKLQSIKDSLINPHKQKPCDQKHSKIQKAFDQKKRTMDFELDVLRKTHEREQENNQSKINRLNFTINYMQLKNKELEAQNAELHRSNKILNGIIDQSGYVVQQRQLFHMASQQLFQVKNQYKKEKKQKQFLNRLVERLKNKIYMLVSLIGYGVVSNIQNNDLHDLHLFRNNIQNVNKVQSKLTIDVCGLQSIKSYKCATQVKQIADQEDPWSCLFQSNFLIMFEDQQIKNALEENGTTIIKPEFFLLMRAIFDSKYSQFLIQGDKTNRFQDFTYTFIDFFRLKKNQKRIQINSKRSGDQKDFMKTNFLMRIFDKKVGFLPQIITFRQFLIKNTPQDQVFYYLLCRNFIYNGPELDNYISCSDPYNFVPYQRVLEKVQQILQTTQKSTKTIIFNHLNQKKIMKNKRLLIRANYVIRLLLSVYRKYKKDKIIKLRYIFQQTCKFTKCQFLKFVHFRQILRKNFIYLTNTDICTYYRNSMSIFHTQSQSTFFQAFSASCLEYIFLQENLKFNEELIMKKNCKQVLDNFNYIMQLIPESVSQVGNQLIYNQYINFIKLKGLNLERKVKITKFLLKIVYLRLPSIQNCQKQQSSLTELLDGFNNKLIDYINQNFRKRQKYEQSLEKASSTIGKEFKKKIYQFYSQFIKDIKNQIQINNPVAHN